MATCDTCRRLLNELNLPAGILKQEIKSNPLSLEQIEELKLLAGRYEELFNKRAQLYRKRNLKDKVLHEQDYKDLLLEHYTFLKRPVFVLNGKAFIGSSKKVVEALKAELSKN